MAKVAGFKPPTRTALVKFEEDSPYHGAEITMRLNVPMGLVFELQRFNADSSDQEATIRRLGDSLLMGWNVTDDGDNPLPANGEGLLTQSPDFIWAIIGGWNEAMTVPSAPLSLPSTNGSSSAGRPTRKAGR